MIFGDCLQTLMDKEDSFKVLIIVFLALFDFWAL